MHEMNQLEKTFQSHQHVSPQLNRLTLGWFVLSFTTTPIWIPCQFHIVKHMQNAKQPYIGNTVLRLFYTLNALYTSITIYILHIFIFMDFYHRIKFMRFLREFSNALHFSIIHHLDSSKHQFSPSNSFIWFSFGHKNNVHLPIEVNCGFVPVAHSIRWVPLAMPVPKPVSDRLLVCAHAKCASINRI